jgi:methionine-rich copper-binding protein CopC
MRIRHLVAAALVAAAAAAPPATAHVERVATSPRAGTSVPKTVRAVTATFSGQVRSARIVVRNARRVVVSVGTGRVDPRNVRRIRTTLRRGLSAGRYTASYSIVTADLHKLQGGWTFRLR